MRTLPLVCALALAVTIPTAARAAPAATPAPLYTMAGAVPGEYIVVFGGVRDSVRSALGSSSGSGLRAALGLTAAEATVGYTYTTALRGFSARLSPAGLAKVRADPSVRYVSANGVNHQAEQLAPVTQDNPPNYGVDRIDQAALPLDRKYTYDADGSGVRIYVVDGGIRSTHTDFGGRVAVSEGHSIFPGDTEDCPSNGHGTHVASTAGGTVYGVAKKAILVPVRQFEGCNSSNTDADVVKATDWLTANARKPAVANYSTGDPDLTHPTVDDAIEALHDSGVTVVVAAGNNSKDACQTSPSNRRSLISVGSTDSTDTFNSGTDWGTCVDLFAPGVNIVAANAAGDTGSTTKTGTSMATPHVSGAAAMYLQGHPTATPAQVEAALVAAASTVAIKNVPGTGSPNKLLNVSSFAGGPAADDFSLAVSPAAGHTAPAGSVTATVATTTTAGNPQTVALTATGLPAGVTASFDPPSVTSGASATMTLAVAGTARAGGYPVTVTGAGGVSRSAAYTLTVDGDAPPEFSVAVTPATATVQPGGTATATVATTTVSGTPQALTLGAGGAPAGVTVAFSPPSVTSGASATMTVSVGAATAPGTYPLTVSASGLSTHAVTYTLTVSPPSGGRTFRADTDFPIRDNQRIYSPVSSTATGQAAGTVTVRLAITHTCAEDLGLTLVAPGGQLYTMKYSGGYPCTPWTGERAFTIANVSSAAAGTWQLRVTDYGPGDTGTLDYWSVTL